MSSYDSEGKCQSRVGFESLGVVVSTFSSSEVNAQLLYCVDQRKRVRGCDSNENNGMGNSLASHKQRLVQDEPVRSRARDPERAGLALWGELRSESFLFLSKLV